MVRSRARTPKSQTELQMQKKKTKKKTPSHDRRFRKSEGNRPLGNQSPSLHTVDVRQRDRVCRDVAPRVVATRDDGRRDERHAPVLGLQLGRLEGRPDGQHALA